MQQLDTNTHYLYSIQCKPRDAVSIKLSMSDARRLGRWLLENAEEDD